MKTKETKALTKAMLHAGISRSELARRTGFKLSSINTFLSGYEQGRLTKLKIETVLGPIWSTQEKFDYRRRFAKAFGIDPYLAGIREVRRRASRLKIKGFTMYPHKRSLIKFIAKHLLINPPAGADAGNTKEPRS